MTMVPIPLDMKALDPPATDGATPINRQGANFPVSGARFDAVVQQSAWYACRADGYSGTDGSKNLEFEFEWYSEGGSTSGTIVVETQVAAVTPETDAVDVEAKAPAALNFVQDTNLGGTAKRPHRAVVTLTNLDNLNDGDIFWLKVARDADSTSATDNMAGNLIIMNGVLREAA